MPSTQYFQDKRCPRIVAFQWSTKLGLLPEKYPEWFHAAMPSCYLERFHDGRTALVIVRITGKVVAFEDDWIVRDQHGYRAICDSMFRLEYESCKKLV